MYASLNINIQYVLSEIFKLEFMVKMGKIFLLNYISQRAK